MMSMEPLYNTYALLPPVSEETLKPKLYTRPSGKLWMVMAKAVFRPMRMSCFSDCSASHNHSSSSSSSSSNSSSSSSSTH